jgi:hypothetical protein
LDAVEGRASVGGAATSGNDAIMAPGTGETEFTGREPAPPGRTGEVPDSGGAFAADPLERLLDKSWAGLPTAAEVAERGVTVLTAANVGRVAFGGSKIEDGGRAGTTVVGCCNVSLADTDTIKTFDEPAAEVAS